jgi:major intracellular serine protease
MALVVGHAETAGGAATGAREAARRMGPQAIAYTVRVGKDGVTDRRLVRAPVWLIGLIEAGMVAWPYLRSLMRRYGLGGWADATAHHRGRTAAPDVPYAQVYAEDTQAIWAVLSKNAAEDAGVVPTQLEPPANTPIATTLVIEKGEVVPEGAANPLTSDTDHAAMGWAARDDFPQGEGAVVAVLDTGCADRHPALGDWVIGRIDCTGSNPSGIDRNGHGTFCISQIGGRDSRYNQVGGAKRVKVLSIQVLTAAGWGTDAMIARGVQVAIQARVDAISASIGGPSPMPLTQAAIREARAAGIPVICAAGNSGPNTSDVDYPARYEECLAVGAVDQDNRIATFSSRGPGVDVVARGVRQWGAVHTGGYAQWSGTSMAAPHVAAVVALGAGECIRVGRPVPHASVVYRSLIQTAGDLGVPGPDRDTGHGIVHAGRHCDDIIIGTNPDPVADVIQEVDPDAPTRSTLLMLAECLKDVAAGLRVLLVPKWSPDPAADAGVPIPQPTPDDDDTTPIVPPLTKDADGKWVDQHGIPA